MKEKKKSNSFRGSFKKDEIFVSQSARINMNNSSNDFRFINGSQNFFKMNSFSQLSDLKKTFVLNIDILKKFITSSQNPINIDNQIINLLNSLIERHKTKIKIIEKIREKKSKLLIDNQINSEKKRKSEERRFYLMEKIKDNIERINSKEEYMKVLHKKMREVEIYIHKNTFNIKETERRKKYQTFSMFDFIETNNELTRQKKDLNKQLVQTMNNYNIEFEENKKLKEEEKNEKEEEKKKENEQNKIKNLTEKYKQKIKIMSLRLNLLKNTYKKVNKKIKILKIGELNHLDNEEEKNENEQSKIQLDTTNMKNSFMDFSTVLNKNFEESKFELSKIGNNFGNVSNFGIYDISIINYK